MFKKKCRCGQAEKNFHVDIGPFYVGDCCLEAGFDDLGNAREATPAAESLITQGEKVVDLLGLKPSDEPKAAPQKEIDPELLVEETQNNISETRVSKILSYLALGNKLNKGRVKDLRLDELKSLADERGVDYSEDTTRLQLMDVLLK